MSFRAKTQARDPAAGACGLPPPTEPAAPRVWAFGIGGIGVPSVEGLAGQQPGLTTAHSDRSLVAAGGLPVMST